MQQRSPKNCWCVQGACRVPITTIASNAGEQGAVIVEKILQQNDPEYGFDAYTGEYKNMVEVMTNECSKISICFASPYCLTR